MYHQMAKLMIMLPVLFQIMGITEEKTGRETFVSAAFPSACGKTNMAMLTPSISGYKVQCVGE